MFLNPIEQAVSEEYLKQGYIIRPAADVEALTWIRNQFMRLLAENIGTNPSEKVEDVLNHIHRSVPVAELNTFRLKIIRGFNAIEGFREMYYRVARPYLETLVGNELAMQLRINTNEVAHAFEVPLAYLMNPANHRWHVWEFEGVQRQWLSMPYQDGPDQRFIWGATAGMLRNFYRFLQA